MAQTICRHLGLADRHGRLPLRLHGRLRPRHRHPVPLVRGERRPRPRGEHRRAGVGRQRDLAGAGGGGLFAVFPLAYATIMPALYMPMILMLLALVFRGVAFEMRFRATTRAAALVGPAFSGGSYVAAFCQGIAWAPSSRASGGGARLCRRLVGLADAVLGADRRWRWWPAMRCSAPAG